MGILKYTNSAALSGLLLAGCASHEPKVEAPPAPIPEPVVQEVEAPEPVAVAPIDGVYFPELQGTWDGECRLFDEDEPDGSYETTRYTVQGNDYKTDTTVYQDSGCNTVLSRGFFQYGSSIQTYGTLERPAGSASTQMGSAAYIDINHAKYTIDDKPLAAKIASFFQPETGYSIVLVEGNQFFLGDDNGNDDGESAASRPTELDMSQSYTKQ